MLSYSRGALLALGDRARASGSRSCRCGCARVVALVGVAVADGRRVVAWAFAQDGLTDDRAPMALRVDAGQELGALLLLLLVALARRRPRRRLPRRRSARRPRARAGSREPRAARRARASSRVAILMLATAPGGHRRPGLEGVEAGHRPAGAHARQHARTG